MPALGQPAPSEEIARLGDEIYERDVRKQVVADHDGEYVAIDVESGKWAVADEVARRCRERLREKQPEAIDVWLLRVGYRAVGSLGGGAPRRTG